MDAAFDNDATAQHGGDITYSYKPSLMGAPFEFRLAPDALEWRKGKFVGRAPYNQIRRIRLSFRPMTMQHSRFLAEVWPVGAPKLQIASTSSKSLVEHERFDAGYRAFVIELSRRVGASGAKTEFDAGSPGLIYWPGAVVFGGALLGMAALLVRALLTAIWGGAAFIAAFIALFIWQAGGFLYRNRPDSYRPDAVPPRLLPKA